MKNKKRFFENVPIKQGEKVLIKIVAKGTKGGGIGFVKGFAIIIPKANKGEELEVEITKVFEKYAFARVLV